MNARIVVTLDQHEVRTITDAVNPVVKLVTLTEPEEGLLRALNEGGQREFIRETLSTLRGLLESLQASIEAETEGHAAPEWVAQAKAIRESGGVPVFMDPEHAVSLIVAARKAQLAAIQGAMAVVQRAGEFVSIGCQEGRD